MPRFSYWNLQAVAPDTITKIVLLTHVTFTAIKSHDVVRVELHVHTWPGPTQNGMLAKSEKQGWHFTWYGGELTLQRDIHESAICQAPFQCVWQLTC
jgi:hypothetical protein